jgi:hypothetical protein
MAASATLTLDTTAPDAAVDINSGGTVTSSRDVTLTITSAASDKAFVKIYGDVDDAFDTANYRALEANAPWISFVGTKSVRLSVTDGTKVVRVKVKDDVDNVSTEATDSISLSTAIPTITISVALTPTKISKQTGKRTATLSFQSDVALQAWKVKVVPAANSVDTAGVQIPTTGGSLNVTGGSLAATTNQQVTIDGADLETASAGDGAKIVKVFGQATSNGLWSAGAT